MLIAGSCPVNPLISESYLTFPFGLQILLSLFLYIPDIGRTLPEANGRFKQQNRTNTIAAPSEATEIPSIPATSNVLCVRGARHGDGERKSSNSLFVTFADRSLIEISSSPPHKRITDVASLHNGPILSVYPLQGGQALTTSMSGQLILHGPRGYSSSTDVAILERRSDHSKYAVHVSATSFAAHWIVATAGWDQKVQVYATPFESASETLVLGDPAATLSLPSNPESFAFVLHPNSKALYLVLSRRDSTYIYYYLIDPNPSESPGITVHEAGKQNLAPHANAWIAFSPSCLALSPTDPTLLAVATSHLPHMKLIVVRLLFPDVMTAASGGLGAPPLTPASQARAALALSDREDAAISLHVSTLAPQTPYSTPQVVWRPDGSGLWVNGDDGVVRGLDIMTGKVVALLKGHEPGTKVRSLWAGIVSVADDVDDSHEEEWLVSGGFDKRVIVWKVASHQAPAADT
jgi:WD40 repeat protein